MEYKPDKLRDYIQNAEVRVVNDSFKVRLSTDLAAKYDAGIYQEDIARHDRYIKEINALGIQYPGGAHPVFYMYIVPDENCVELLKLPSGFTNGGRPVSSFDLDGFNVAYGRSQNCLEGSLKPETIARRVNGIHEFAHLVHGQFFSKDSLFIEGFAEALPLYTMGLEGEFDEHRAVIKNMKFDDILSPQELLAMGNEGTFYSTLQGLNKTGSFDRSYISSYLFVRGYMAEMGEKFGLDRKKTTQKFLETMRGSSSCNQWLVYDLAAVIGMPGDELLNTKKMQLKAQTEITKLDHSILALQQAKNNRHSR